MTTGPAKGTHARPGPHVIVLFGATGDLAKRKLLPGLYPLFVAGLLPEKFAIVGTSPPEFAVSEDEFRKHARSACDQFGVAKPFGEPWEKFVSHLTFASASPEDPSPLVGAVAAAEKAIANGNGNGKSHGNSHAAQGGREGAAVPPGDPAVGVRVGGGDAWRIRARLPQLPGDRREAVRLGPG